MHAQAHGRFSGIIELSDFQISLPLTDKWADQVCVTMMSMVQ